MRILASIVFIAGVAAFSATSLAVTAAYSRVFEYPSFDATLDRILIQAKSELQVKGLKKMFQTQQIAGVEYFQKMRTILNKED